MVDDKDACPDTPGEVRLQGCPDSDGDGVIDDRDKCPEQAEVFNGVDDEDGCPDQGKAKAVVTSEKIEILEKVHFDTAKATIKARSFPLLDNVSGLLRSNSQITRVRVEGHTDNQGGDAYNLDLSQRRAAAVRDYMIEKGVHPLVLEAKGFGESRPIAPNATAAGREQNRRVEFVILEIDGQPIAPGTGGSDGAETPQTD